MTINSQYGSRNLGVRSLGAFINLLAIISALLMPATELGVRATPPTTRPDISADAAAQRTYFEENRGQFNPKARFLARGTSGYDLFLTATDAVYVLSEPTPGKRTAPTAGFKPDEREPQSAVAVYMSLVGANPDAGSTGSELREHRTNYFKGAESNWRTDIPNYGQVRMENVYQGVDTVWHGREQGGVQYDFVVAPGANPAQVEWEVKGAKSVELDAEGNLVIGTEYGDIKQNKPFTYQDANGLRSEIESRFIVADGAKVRFDLGNYDTSKPLVIDPSVNLSNLSYSTLLGGGFGEEGRSIKVDSAENVYVTGRTNSFEFPTTPGTFDTSANQQDVFVSKINASGTALIYSTFVGGSGQDVANDLFIDAVGNAFITGITGDSTTDFPTTAGAFDTTHNGDDDVFVTKLNSTGSALTYSTLIGGSSSDESYGIAVDSSGNAFIAGNSSDGAVDYPTTAGAFDTTINGLTDAVVTKVNSSGSSLTYSTFMGGSFTDSARAIEIDSSGNAYVIGHTEDAVVDFPTTAGSIDATANGGNDAFVTKLNPSGSALSYSTFLGGSINDIGEDIAIDSSGNVYVTGNTNSTNFPLSFFGGYDTSANGQTDAFVSKINSTGNGLMYSTYIGGDSSDMGYGIAVDSAGYAYVTGETFNGAIDYPTTANAFDPIHNGFYDVFVTKVNTIGSDLVYSTYIGGSDEEAGYAIAVDAFGNTFVTGTSFLSSPGFPTTGEAFQPAHAGGSDVFISKLGDFSISGRSVDTSGAPLANTAIAFSNDCDGFMLSDANGYFVLGDTIIGGSCLVSATQILYNFNPSNYEVNVNRNKRLTFVGRPTTSGPTAAFADLGGDVTSAVGNTGLPFTQLTLIDTYGNIRTTTTDANGNYEFGNVETGAFYFVVAKREGYNFEPSDAAITFLEENLDVNFHAVPNSPRPQDDFDGDGKSDLAVFRPSEGNWYVLESQSGAMRVTRFGATGDVPVAEDYDGDRRADIAVYRPTDGNWYRLNSTDGAFSATRFGLGDDKPVPADFDGDGKTDLAVYRPSSGVWHRLNSTDGAYSATKFGLASDKPVPADFDSDGKADMAVYRDGTWYRMNSSNGQTSTISFGLPEDRPMALDFDGDSRPDIAVFRPSSGTWYWLDSLDGDQHAVNFGIATDIPVAADYDGDGRVEQAVYRAGDWFMLLPNGNWSVRNFGAVADVPSPAIR